VARLLYRLGQFSARRAWFVIVGWVVLIGIAAGAFLAFGGTLTSNFSIPGTATEQATDRLKQAMPDYAGAAATVVFQTEDGAFTATQESGIADLLAEVAKVEGVAEVVDPFETEQERADQLEQLADSVQQLEAGQAQLDAAVAQAKAAGVYEAAKAQLDAQQQQLDAGQAQVDLGRRIADAAAGVHMVSDDGRTALGTVLFDNGFFTLTTETKNAVTDVLKAARIDGVTIDWSSEITASLDGIIGPGEIIGVALALLVLLVMLRAVLPALLPIISSLIGVGLGIVTALAFSGAFQMSTVTPALGVMLGLAVGIDYALFIINRHRHELAHGVELRESIGLANGTAGSAVVFAGATVVVALLALLVTGVPFLGVMGVVAAFCVLVAVLVAVTLVPAVLGLIGMRVLSRRLRREGERPPRTTPRPMRTWAAIVSVVAGVVALLILAIPALSMRLALLDVASEPQDSTQYRTYQIVNEEFGEGRNGALVVLAELPSAIADGDQLALEAELADFLMAQDDVVAAVPLGVADAGDLIAFQVVPDSGSTSAETAALVADLRDATPPDGVASLAVAGSASAAMDISDKLAAALPLFLTIIVVIAFVLLVLVFRSLLVPLVATAGFVLSLFAALGAVTAVYQWGWLGGLFQVHDPGPVLAFAPILVLGMLFGLAMDYQLFLVTGMREAYVHGQPARIAVTAGFRAGRSVVTAAAIIMASVFGGFIYSEIGTIRPLGFGLAFGVLFDAFIVRMLIMPGLMHLLGGAAWWMPKWLDRILPDVDVEGAALERGHATAIEAAEPGKG